MTWDTTVGAVNATVRVSMLEKTSVKLSRRLQCAADEENATAECVVASPADLALSPGYTVNARTGPVLRIRKGTYAVATGIAFADPVFAALNGAEMTVDATSKRYIVYLRMTEKCAPAMETVSAESASVRRLNPGVLYTLENSVRRILRGLKEKKVCAEN